MEGTAVLGRLSWLPATVTAVRPETERVKTILFECPGWESHMAGQHVDVRLTAEDGYQAQRSYSIASAPSDDHLALTVERLQDGEVSPYLTDVLEPGDQLEMRGPIGRFFVWEESLDGPLFMIAGGSGVVPFRAMLRQRAAGTSQVPTRLLFSVRTIDDVIYHEELMELSATPGIEVSLSLTRAQPEGWDGYARRVDREMLEDVAWQPGEMARIYVCGPTPFVETVAVGLVDLGHSPSLIMTERFGPTG